MSTLVNPFAARPKKYNTTENSGKQPIPQVTLYHIYHGYKYSLPSIAGFIRHSVDYYLFPPPEITGAQGSERVKENIGKNIFLVLDGSIKK